MKIADLLLLSPLHALLCGQVPVHHERLGIHLENLDGLNCRFCEVRAIFLCKPARAVIEGDP